MKNAFRDALENGEFVVTCEMIPGRGAFEAYQEEDHLKMKAIYETGLVHAISITDCPSGNPAISPPTVARRFAREGIPSIVHYSCKDRSRNMMQGELYAMQLRGLENLLIMSGDYQGSGFEGAGRPDFDLDSVNALRLVSAMNEGLIVQGRDGERRETPANFFPGAVVNPYKYREGESIPQYLKLEKKLIAGAKFIIQQLGFDARKMQEQLFYVEERGYDVPMIANVFMLTKTSAAMMREGRIAGCTVTDALMAELEHEADENKLRPGYARDKRIERAAKQIAVACGLGYAGVHIGGVGLDADTVTDVIDRARDYVDDWRDYVRELSCGKEGGFYLYAPELDADGQPTGLNTREHSDMSEDVSNRKLFKGYRSSRVFHKLFLTQEYDENNDIVGRKGMNGLLAWRMEHLDHKKGANRSHGLEHGCKAVLYGCIDCGDCGLEAVAYSCPMASCPKSERNGPCGGSMDGYCEVYPPTSGEGARFCVHYMAYHRFKRSGELDRYRSFITPPNDWTYWQHSAWSNYTHGRDNIAKRIPVDIGFDGAPGGLPKDDET
ncbi:MAG: methylenetetrahydrofolate reductase C-terminal domain-containing protein [Coriobacteriales bacterium]